jgi:hypothetical protein
MLVQGLRAYKKGCLRSAQNRRNNIRILHDQLFIKLILFLGEGGKEVTKL